MPKIKYNSGSVINKFLSYRLVVLTSNYIFQGIRYMSLGEKIYKISVTIIFSLLVFLLLNNLVISIIIGHTLNYIINGQFFVVYRYLSNGRTMSNMTLTEFLNLIKKNIVFFTVKDVLITGSFCRGKMSKTSDLDIRIYHKSDLFSSIKAYLFASKLRFFGLILKFPVDVFCFSQLSFLDKLDKIEIPVNFLNHNSIIKKYPGSINYKEQLRKIEIN